MVKGQNNKLNNKLKSKNFYIWMLSGVLTVVCICAVCFNLPELNKSKELTDLNEPKVESQGNANVANEVTDIADNSENNVPQSDESEEINLLEHDIYDENENESSLSQVTKPVETVEPSENTEVPTVAIQEEEAVSVMQNDTKPISEKLSFDEDAGLLWPANGNVIMNYSDEKGIYFATLGQYKVNPAILIGAEEETEVVSATKGTIDEIIENEETGTTIKMSIGNDYVLTYGQLKDLKVEVGDTVEEGQVLGCIAKPTKYYVVEGANLYFQVTQNGEPVNPLYLLR
ncbi:M23 family metallopeptidase [Anaeromicropila populeti]|uniref:Peptidase family M23 n=1 Tax=Anaeromicropila populeti TaxID=37658 RepID=A0A1I6I6X3_9FIRM|nr:M23 family metallopeptidase [Anaeromicropila populeti]SFR62404.1 Peptidase family M23 [Anaeromicropila populeti]